MIKKSIKMVQFLVFIGLLVSCQDQSYKLLPEPVNPLEGKVKAVRIINDKGNKLITEWVYNQETKQITGAKSIDSLNNITTTETYKRDTDGKLTSISIEVLKDGISTKSEKTYQYNDKNQVINTTETIGDEQTIEDLLYDADGKIIRYTISNKKANRTSVLRLVQYTWKGANVSSIKDRNLQLGYEEVDYQYNGSDNALAKLYRDELKLINFTPEFISQNQPVSSVRLFEGSRFKFEYEFDKENKLIGYKTLLNKNGNWEVFNEMKIEYHAKNQ